MTTFGSSVPTSFAPLVAPAGFVLHCGGFHVHEQLPVLGLRVGEHLLNSVRIVHGGFLATLADTAFGVILKRQFDLPTPPLTVSLTLEYLGKVQQGEWLEAHVQVLKSGRSFISADCRLKVGERTVLRASGIFTRWKGQMPNAG